MTSLVMAMEVAKYTLKLVVLMTEELMKIIINSKRGVAELVGRIVMVTGSYIFSLFRVIIPDGEASICCLLQVFVSREMKRPVGEVGKTRGNNGSGGLGKV